MADKSQTATSVVAGSTAHRIANVMLAEAVTAGQIAYRLPVGTYGLADANDANKYNVVGYFEQGGAAGQRVNVIDKDPNANLGITGAIGDCIILSTNPGSIAPDTDTASGSFITILGVFTSTTTVNFAPLASGSVRP